MEKAYSNQTEALGQGSVGKLLFKLAAPAIAAQIINLLYNLVDRMYIGHIPVVGKLALTGVGVCLPLIMIISAFAALVSMGSAPRASIFLGKGDKETAEKTMGNSLSLLVIISVILTTVFLLFSEELLLAFGASAETVGYGTDYMLIYSMGTIFVQLTLGLNAFISAQGFAKISMLTVLIGAISNIILDPIFIFAFNMGVKGAALATIISQGISMVWILFFLTGKKTSIRIKLKNLKLSPSIFLPCIALGLAPFIMQSTESLIAVCFNRSLLEYGGDLAVGAMTILTSCMQFSMLPLMGLSQGAQPIMSYNFGARNAERVRRAFKLLLMSCLIYSVSMWIAIEAFPEIFIKIFNDDAELIAFTVPALRIYMLMTGIFGIQLACQQAFVSLGNAKASLSVAILRKIILLIPLIYIMPALGIFKDKTTAVFAAEPIADFISVVFTAILFSVQFKKAMRSIDSGSQDEHRLSPLYRSMRKMVCWFTPKIETVWEQPFAGRPAVFVCNHDRAYGPIAMCAHFDMADDIRPWINAPVLSAREMPKYVREDYWWDCDKWYSPILGHTLVYAYALFIPPILRGSDCIPVYHDTSVAATLKKSVKYLKDGKHLLLFPERPKGYCKYEAEINDGFVSIGRLTYARSKQIVDFYPGYIDWKNHKIFIGTPVSYNPEAPYDEQTKLVSARVESFFAGHREG